MVKLELGGVDERQVDVVVFDDLLVVSGSREDHAARAEDVVYHLAGVRYGPFQCQVPLPNARFGRCRVSYEQEFLCVVLSKSD